MGCRWVWGSPYPLCAAALSQAPVAVEGFLLQGQPSSGAWHGGDRSLHESCVDACVPLSVHRPLYFLLLYSAHKQERCSLLTLGFPRAASRLCVMLKEEEVWAGAGRDPGLASRSLAGAFLSFATQQANASGSGGSQAWICSLQLHLLMYAMRWVHWKCWQRCPDCCWWLCSAFLRGTDLCTKTWVRILGFAGIDSVALCGHSWVQP